MLILIPLIIAIICVLIAHKKDRSKVLAFFLALIFGIFALFGYILCQEGGRKCPQCGMRIRRDVRKCRYCGSEVNKVR